jgi:hypothetical protein
VKRHKSTNAPPQSVHNRKWTARKTGPWGPPKTDPQGEEWQRQRSARAKFRIRTGAVEKINKNSTLSPKAMVKHPAAQSRKSARQADISSQIDTPQNGGTRLRHIFGVISITSRTANMLPPFFGRKICHFHG